jgi:hypothetical protein
MTRRERRSATDQGPATIDGALAALDADELRELMRDVLLELDERTRGRILDELIDRAARNSSAWTPSGPSSELIASVHAFVEAAKLVGYAEPSDVDDYLRHGINAFLSKSYPKAAVILRALLIPVGGADIDLGQHEMVDEVLTVDVSACAAQYVVSTYMTAAPADRAKAVLAAIRDVEDVGHFWDPLGEMERVAVEPLSEFHEFLPRWRELIESRMAGSRNGNAHSDSGRWLREVVQRMDGAAGLAELALSTRHEDDLRAWCRGLALQRDWQAALAAYEEAAAIVNDNAHAHGEFLDGVALAAQELGHKDLSTRLEQAWRGAPTFLRLYRWLGSSGNNEEATSRAREALQSCAKKAHRQRALLHVVAGDLEAAAKLLAAAPGLGWSDDDHPGHLLFLLFEKLLGGAPEEGSFAGRWIDADPLEWINADRDQARLATPEVDDLLELAGVNEKPEVSVQMALLEAMRRAAENRLAGLTKNKRRRHYGHGAQLVATCAALLSSSEANDWVATLRTGYRRYPALQREFDDRVGRA